MTAKRDTSRQRRVNQNRSAREALVARRQAAAQKTAPEPEAPAKRGRLSRAQAEPVVPTRSRGPRAAAGRPVSTPSALPDDEPPASGIVARAQQIIGGRQMLIGFALIVAGSLPAAFVKLPVEQKTGPPHHESLVTALGWGAIPVLLVPIAIAAIPLLTLNNRRRRLAWNVAAFLLAIFVLFTNLLIFYGLGLGAVMWGLIKNSRAEAPPGRRPGLFGRPPRVRDDDAPVDVAGAEANSESASD